MTHQNSQKRIYEENVTYFITTKTYANFPFFKNEILCELFIEELKLCKSLKEFELYAFNILYDHVHLLIKPSVKYDISKVMFSIKKQFSHNVNRILGYNTFPMEGGQALARLQSTKDHDKKVYNLYQEFTKTYTVNSYPKFRWQSSFHDHIIRNQKDFTFHLDYTTQNHLKHITKANYPVEYKYTSINYVELINLS